MRRAFPLAAAVAIVLAASSAAHAADARPLVYVGDTGTSDKALAGDAQVMTTSLCAALSKDKRIDVLCAPDVRQILDFAGTAMLSGTQSPAVTNLQTRLEGAKLVVSSRLAKEGNAVVVLLVAGPRAAASDAMHPDTLEPTLTINERAPTARGVLDKMPAWTARIVQAALPAPVPAPPPAPLSPATAPGDAAATSTTVAPAK